MDEVRGKFVGINPDGQIILEVPAREALLSSNNQSEYRFVNYESGKVVEQIKKLKPSFLSFGGFWNGASLDANVGSGKVPTGVAYYSNGSVSQEFQIVEFKGDHLKLDDEELV